MITLAAVLVPAAASSGLCAAAARGTGTLALREVPVDTRQPEGRSLLGTAFQSRQACVSADLQTDARSAPWHELTAASAVRSAAAVPLVRAGIPVAVMLFGSPQAGAFDTAMIEWLERLARDVCGALAALDDACQGAHADDALARLRAAIDLCVDPVYLTDAQSLRFVHANEPACRRAGRTLEQMRQMGPAQMIRRTPGDIRALIDRVLACAPDAVVSERVETGLDGRRWTSEVSRRALSIGGRPLVVTIPRDLDQRRSEEALQTLQHAATRLLSQTGSMRSVLESVFAGLGPGLGLDHAVCLIDGGAESPGPQRVAYWQREGATAPAAADAPASDALTLAIARAVPHGRIERRQLAAQVQLVVPVAADGSTLGALILTGSGIAPPEQVEPALVALGEQLGQYIRRKQAEQVLAHSEARFRSLTELSSDWYWECDTAHRYTSFGGRNIGDGGASDWRSAFIGRAVWELAHVQPGSGDWAQHRASLERRAPFHDLQFALRGSDGTLRWTSSSGEPVFDAGGTFIGYHGISRDITERRHAEDSIRHLATHDTLTGLPNRALFVEELTRSLREARRDGRQLALLFIDLDHFKVINDTLGHDAGDQLLAQLARSLRECLRPHDLVARLGGDEFVVLVRHPAGHDEAAIVARKLLAAVTQPLSLKGQECRISASVGICLFPDNAADEAGLMKGADIAMYEAKSEGRNAYRFFSADARLQSPLQLRMVSNLRAAIERDEFALHYQPKVDLESGRIVGAEALLRWRNAELGSVPPAQFIALAEETGLMLPIGRWVLRQACAQHVAWCEEGLPPIPLAVNLSPRQFADAELVADLQAALRETGMPAHALELEITEGVLIGHPERARATLHAIKRLGVRLALDDFGTGYSSLAQLKRLPIDTLKVDRSFVQGLPGDARDSAITEAIVALGRTLQLAVVAEGVETVAQREFLRACGCTQMQGYHFSRPLPAQEFATLARRHLAHRHVA